MVVVLVLVLVQYSTGTGTVLVLVLVVVEVRYWLGFGFCVCCVCTVLVFLEKKNGSAGRRVSINRDGITCRNIIWADLYVAGIPIEGHARSCDRKHVTMTTTLHGIFPHSHSL